MGSTARCPTGGAPPPVCSNAMDNTVCDAGPGGARSYLVPRTTDHEVAPYLGVLFLEQPAAKRGDSRCRDARVCENLAIFTQESGDMG